ncbi:hypothetical protein Tsubulata_035103 [Turnera subulata]|uniref:DUF4283 domain-containing protein n=1 Tax=Turnera subulata TaxID=218843 RepID=A0A9Q0FC43_9ROSI|nr:hypothetical protein Tsubulata_035103 [Turnera subulata]
MAAEADQQERSNKKAKRIGEGNEADKGFEGQDRLFTDETRRKISYKSMLSGRPAMEAMDDVPLEEEDEYWSDSDPEEDDDEDPFCPTILLSSADKQRIYKRWRNTLIVKLLGKRVGYRFLHRSLMNQWKPRGEIIMADMGNDFYLLQFNTEYDYNRVLYDGPWLVADHVLTVRRWQPCFDPDEAVIDKAVVWIQFPKLYQEFYDRDILLRVARRAGRPIKVDEVTLKSSRVKYARVCVEIDLTKPLVSKFRLKRRVWRVAYEGLDMVCFTCGLYDHTMDNCRANKTQEDVMEVNDAGDGLTPMAQVPEKVEFEARPELMSNHGPWMLAQKRRRGRPRPTNGGMGSMSGDGQLPKSRGSRFDILRDHQEAELVGAQDTPIELASGPAKQQGLEGPRQNLFPARRNIQPPKPPDIVVAVRDGTGGAGTSEVARNLQHQAQGPKEIALGSGEPSELGFSGGLWIFWRNCGESVRDSGKG